MGDTNISTAALEQNDEELLTSEVSDETLEAAAAPTRLFTAMITDCPTIVASCCGGRT